MAAVDSNPQVSRPAVDHAALVRIGRELLIAIGENPEREGIAHTPERWANWWREFLEYDPGKLDTVFHATTSADLVVVSGIRVWSLCEHHLLPFWCDVSIGYIPANGKVLGLSKFARIAHDHAHHPQIQEQLTAQIADTVCRIGGTEDVVVYSSGEHLCMTMRGIKSPSKMSSLVARGKFDDFNELDKFFTMAERG